MPHATEYTFPLHPRVQGAHDSTVVESRMDNWLGRRKRGWASEQSAGRLELGRLLADSDAISLSENLISRVGRICGITGSWLFHLICVFIIPVSQIRKPQPREISNFPGVRKIRAGTSAPRTLCAQPTTPACLGTAGGEIRNGKGVTENGVIPFSSRFNIFHLKKMVVVTHKLISWLTNRLQPTG